MPLLASFLSEGTKGSSSFDMSKTNLVHEFLPSSIRVLDAKASEKNYFSSLFALKEEKEEEEETEETEEETSFVRLTALDYKSHYRDRYLHFFEQLSNEDCAIAKYCFFMDLCDLMADMKLCCHIDLKNEGQVSFSVLRNDHLVKFDSIEVDHLHFILPVNKLFEGNVSASNQSIPASNLSQLRDYVLKNYKDMDMFAFFDQLYAILRSSSFLPSFGQITHAMRKEEEEEEEEDYNSELYPSILHYFLINYLFMTFLPTCFDFYTTYNNQNKT